MVKARDLPRMLKRLKNKVRLQAASHAIRGIDARRPGLAAPSILFRFLSGGICNHLDAA